METRTTCRNELFVSPGEGGLLRVSTSCGPVLHVATHFFAELVPGCPKTLHVLNNIDEKNIYENERSVFLSLFFSMILYFLVS